MPRPPIPAGEIGKIQIVQTADGRYRARARARDNAGEIRQARVTGRTADEARARLMRNLARYGVAGITDPSPASTVEEACNAWLRSVRARAATGSLSHSTFESYESTVRLTIAPRCGGVTLDALTAGRCDRIIQLILLEQSLSSARRARSVLGLVCGYAVRDEALPRNPVRDVQRLPRPAKKTFVLSPEQIIAIRDLMEHWRESGGMGPRPNFRALADGMDIMLGTSARIGECLALRRCDVDLTSAPPTLSINGTIVQNSAQGIFRKDSPKHSRQRRRIALPAMAASALRRRLALAPSGESALLFQTSTGRPMSVSNYERLLRSFIDDNRESLAHIGVDVEKYSTHAYRRTVATQVERRAGITLASRLLGHASEQTTRSSYVVSCENVDASTADIMGQILGT